ncbi:MAG: hypothetical protein WCH83_11915 [Alphaproteobacteria bacterium]|jgi:hypothetical protein
MTALRVFYGVMAAVLTGTILWAFTAASFGASFAAITGDPWGVVTLVDLYLGFLVAAALIWWVEGPGWRAALIALSIFFLGNVVTAIWAAWRLPMLHAALSKR